MIPKDIQWCSFFSRPSTPLDSLQLPENDPDPEDVAAESTSRIVKSVSDVSELVSCHPHVFFSELVDETSFNLLDMFNPCKD